jgi:hypothetical protein
MKLPRYTSYERSGGQTTRELAPVQGKFTGLPHCLVQPASDLLPQHHQIRGPGGKHADMSYEMNDALANELKGIIITAERVSRRRRSSDKFSVTVLFSFCCEPWLKLYTLLLLCLLACLACCCLVYSPVADASFDMHSFLLCNHAFRHCMSATQVRRSST